MTDNQLRGIVLHAYYEKRREGLFLPTTADLKIQLSEQDILEICDQLSQHGMLDWKALRGQGSIHAGMGKITAFGIDVVEQVATPDIKVEFVKNQTINISGSTNVMVGDNNSQAITQNIRELISFVESSNGSESEKKEAKNLLRKFLAHPLLSAVAGAAISLIA